MRMKMEREGKFLENI